MRDSCISWVPHPVTVANKGLEAFPVVTVAGLGGGSDLSPDFVVIVNSELCWFFLVTYPLSAGHSQHFLLTIPDQPFKLSMTLHPEQHNAGAIHQQKTPDTTDTPSRYVLRMSCDLPMVWKLRVFSTWSEISGHKLELKTFYQGLRNNRWRGVGRHAAGVSKKNFNPFLQCIYPGYNLKHVAVCRKTHHEM